MHDTINDVVASYGYALLVVLVGLESFGIPLPGETALVTAGAFAALDRMNIARPNADFHIGSDVLTSGVVHEEPGSLRYALRPFRERSG